MVNHGRRKQAAYQDRPSPPSDITNRRTHSYMERIDHLDGPLKAKYRQKTGRAAGGNLSTVKVFDIRIEKLL